MPKNFTRHQFLQSGAVLGAGLTLPGTSHILRQNNASDEIMPEDAAYLPLTGSVRQIHDPVIIEENGCRNLTTAPKVVAVRDMLAGVRS